MSTTLNAVSGSYRTSISKYSRRQGSSVPPLRFYRPELDMLRFVAFLLVFVHHGLYSVSPTLSTMGAFGLSLFFFLSAFLITELLQREKGLTGSVAMKRFYIRRSLRIWPLYFCFLSFSFVLGLVLPVYKGPPLFYLSFASMTGNFYTARHGFPVIPAVILWSISVEEQFYLFWPVLNRYCGRRALGLVALAAFPVGMLTLTVLTLKHAGAASMWSNSAVQFQMFACGVLVSLALKSAVPMFSIIRRITLALAGASFWFIAARWSHIMDLAGSPPAIVVCLGYAAVALGSISLFLSAYGIDKRWVSSSLVYLGKVSYGLYVFHWLCLDAAAWMLHQLPYMSLRSHHFIYGFGHLFLGLALAIAAAILSYRYFEKSFLKLKDSFAVVQSRSV